MVYMAARLPVKGYEDWVRFPLIQVFRNSEASAE